MEARKLTREEINELFDFCWSNSVRYYEVQSELVDHIATSIEKRWEMHPEIKFDVALQEVSVEFGGNSGLAKIADEKEKAFRNNYKRQLWKALAEYYKFPKIIFTICLFLSMFGALQIVPDPRWIIFSVVGFGIITIFYFMFFIFRQKILIKNKDFSFLFNQISTYSITMKYIPGIATGIVSSITDMTGVTLGTTKCAIFAGLISLSFVLLYGDCFIVMKGLREDFNKQFPQFA